ncbi:MAG: T9SS type A sorting domain-containing protein [candidate division Zixibacteria bacterium]|nr:T9SS type A sorting domain-containing protein [candidate division Zixibacteria bacterium]
MTKRIQLFLFVITFLIVLSGCYSSWPNYSHSHTPGEWQRNGYYIENNIIDDFKYGFIMTHSFDSNNRAYNFTPAFEVITKYNIKYKRPRLSSSFRFSNVFLVNDSQDLIIPLSIDTIVEINRDIGNNRIVMDSVCLNEFQLDTPPTMFELQYTITIIDNSYTREEYSQTLKNQIYPRGPSDYSKKWTTMDRVTSPFSPTTTFSFEVKSFMPVTIIVYNVEGQIVDTVFNDTKDAGIHSVEWDAKDSENNPLPSGIYFYKIILPDTTIAKKMVLLK